MALRFETGGIRPSGNLEVLVDGVKISAGDTPSLFRNYLASMKGKPLPVDWETRVWLALEARYPKYVKRVKRKGRALMSVSTASHFVQFMLRLLWRRKLESTQVALERAAVCAVCPSQVPVAGCRKCVAAMKEAVKPPERVKEIESLKACSACGCWMPLKVWVPADLLAPMAGDHPYPGNCWMHALQPSSQEPSPSSP